VGHHITGVVARREMLKRLDKLGGQPFFALAEGFAFMPLDDQNLDDLVGVHAGDAVADFVYLTERLIEFLRQASQGGDLAYVETEYHGGTGGQGAVLFHAGEVSFGPRWCENEIGPMNDALARMGITKNPTKFDAFQTIGLDAYRSNEAFRELKRI
jgi:hypothetical protein